LHPFLHEFFILLIGKLKSHTFSSICFYFYSICTTIQLKESNTRNVGNEQAQKQEWRKSQNNNINQYQEEVDDDQAMTSMKIIISLVLKKSWNSTWNATIQNNNEGKNMRIIS
jgi:hypothetical protein